MLKIVEVVLELKTDTTWLQLRHRQILDFQTAGYLTNKH